METIVVPLDDSLDHHLRAHVPDRGGPLKPDHTSPTATLAVGPYGANEPPRLADMAASPTLTQQQSFIDLDGASGRTLDRLRCRKLTLANARLIR